MLLSGRVALITGGAKGIGRGIALKFAGEGCSIAIADINTKEANATIVEVTKKGQKGLALKCDTTDSKQVKDTVNSVVDKFGKIDILVNNAGGLPREFLLEDLPEEEWDKVLDLNLKSGFLFSKAVIRHMKEKRYGKIINISSIGAVYPPSASVHYAAAKAGVLGLTYATAFEYASFNIYANAILPGPTRTAFWDPLVPPAADKEAIFNQVAKNEVPLQKIGTPDDIAGTALFLASELSSFVTGTGIMVTGGMPLKPYSPGK
jgi:NAD(P)-dependent dehydrogenase (short-subunit alcohol dehydrogenase family)